MLRIITVLLIITLLTPASISKNKNSADSSFLVLLNQQIDNYVVQRNIIALDTLYANDFVFSHGTGLIEGKATWLAAVRRGNYPFRKHDSVTAEMHPGVGILRGKLFILRMDKDKKAQYMLKYVRIYAHRNKRWEMISHITNYEQDQL